MHSLVPARTRRARVSRRVDDLAALAASIIALAADWAQAKTPVRLMSTVRFHSSSGTVSGAPIPAPMPALLTRMSTPPNSSTARWIICSMSASLVTSACIATALYPSPVSFAAVRSACSVLMSATDDGRSRLGQRTGEIGAESRTRSGHDRNLAGQIEQPRSCFDTPSRQSRSLESGSDLLPQSCTAAIKSA